MRQQASGVREYARNCVSCWSAIDHSWCSSCCGRSSPMANQGARGLDRTNRRRIDERPHRNVNVGPVSHDGEKQRPAGRAPGVVQLVLPDEIRPCGAFLGRTTTGHCCSSRQRQVSERLARASRKGAIASRSKPRTGVDLRGNSNEASPKWCSCGPARRWVGLRSWCPGFGSGDSHSRQSPGLPGGVGRPKFVHRIRRPGTFRR